MSNRKTITLFLSIIFAFSGIATCIWIVLPDIYLYTYMTNPNEENLNRLYQMNGRTFPLIADEVLSHDRVLSGLRAFIVHPDNRRFSIPYLREKYHSSDSSFVKNKSVFLLALMDDYSLLPDWIVHLKKVAFSERDSTHFVDPYHRQLQIKFGIKVPPITIIDPTRVGRNPAFKKWKINPSFESWLYQQPSFKTLK